MNRDDVVTLEITSLDADGLGLAAAGEHSVLVHGAAPGDQVTVHIDHVSQHRKVAWASISAVSRRGEAFVEPPCPHAAPLRGRCGGCPLMHIEEGTQHDLKSRRVAVAMEETAWRRPVRVHAAPTALHYRVRTHLVATCGDDGRMRLGVYAPRSHELVQIPECLVVRPPLTTMPADIAAALRPAAVPIFPDRDGLRYVTLRADVGGRVLVDLVVGGHTPTWLASAVDRLAALPEVVGVAWTPNTSAGNAIRVTTSRHLWGQEWFAEPFGDVAVATDAGSFTQLHPDLATQMYTQAARWLGPRACLWDLYCGVGAFGKTVASVWAAQGQATELLGAESYARACELARHLSGDGQRFDIVDLRYDTPTAWPAPDAVLVNPPRRGLDEPVRELLARLQVPVAYMSCGPESFARDVVALGERGFELVELEAYDMLPQTTHVELLGLFAPAGSGVSQ